MFAVSGSSFCWVSKTNGAVQLFPALGSGAARSRALQRKGDLTVCVRCATGEIDAEYKDPQAVLKPLWSYVGFRPTDCSFEYGCNLIRQAYVEAGTPKAIGEKTVRLRDQETAVNLVNHTESTAPTFNEIKIRIEEMRDRIVRIGRTVGAAIAREDPATMISRLEREGFVPGNVASMMHLIRSERNRIKYENHMPSNSEWSTIQSAWSVIEEWWDRADESKSPAGTH